MLIPRLLLTGFDHANSTTFLHGPSQSVMTTPSLFAQLWTWVANHAVYTLQWLRQPHILALVVAWWVTFTIVLLLLSAVGFNPVGIGASTLAAAFQSCVYGGFTPAGGVFATLTSMAMLGYLLPLQTIFSAMVATIVTIVVWACGAGR